MLTQTPPAIRRSSFFALWSAAALLLFVGGLMPAAPASAQTEAQPAPATNNVISFDIPAQDLSDALSDFARQSGQDLLYRPEQASGRTAAAVQGAMTTAEAMRRLLTDTGLEFEFHHTGSMLIGDQATLEYYRRQLESPGSAAAGQNTVGQRRPGIEEIIVTGQKREERIQDVPIAISAFSPEDLEAQKIEGGFDLLKGVPNVTFSKTNFTGYNFQIRGIGTQAVSATTDPAVAVSFNSTTLIVNRLFEQEYLDVERVEVLRGPQGTLFGRNATGGVINVISKKPEIGVWDGMIDVEVGNYNTRRLRGFFNAPIGDEFAIRGAYASTVRDGFGYNLASETNEERTFGDDVSADVDNRDLWTGRITLGWQPIDRLRFNLLWERFEEDDQRVRTSKQLCHRDSGDAMLGEESTIFSGPDFNGISPGPDGRFGANWSFFTSDLSQGCLPGSLYSDDAYGTPNGASLPYVSGIFWGHHYTSLIGGRAGMGGNPYFDFAQLGGIPGDNADFFHQALGLTPEGADCTMETLLYGNMAPVDLCHLDIYDGLKQSRDLRTIYSELEPQYRATADILELSFDLELNDNLLLSSQTVYVKDEYYATQDYNRFRSFPVWNDSSQACDISNTPFGNFPNCNPDGFPALGIPPGGRGVFQDGFYADLSPGGVVCDPQLGCSNRLMVRDLAQSESKQYNQEIRLVSSYSGDWNFSLGANFTRFDTIVDYYIFSNSFAYMLNFFPFNDHTTDCAEQNLQNIGGEDCIYTDPNPLEDINGEGHNYFRSANPYKLTSQAVFGELYWKVTDTVKLTAGLRFTWDRKVFTPIPSQLLLNDYREVGGGGDGSILEGDPPSDCTDNEDCQLAGNAVGGRGSPANPDIVQEWREPTGRLVVDWQPVLDFTDESMFYASFSHGYKGGGANPPSVAAPSGLILKQASGGFAAEPTFEPEYVNAYEVGTKNTLLGGALILNGTAFYYDYTDYQVSKILDRSAVNENFDAEIWGLELETVFAPSLNWQFNAAIGWLQTKVGNGEKSIDLMDRADGGNRTFVLEESFEIIDDEGEVVYRAESFDEWTVVKPWVSAASNCVLPVEVLEFQMRTFNRGEGGFFFHAYCPVGQAIGLHPRSNSRPAYDVDGNFLGEYVFDPATQSPNGGRGFMKNLSGNEMPNSPEFTVALGAQYNFDLTRDWRATARVDYYWQDESYARIYNTEYDRLKSWSNTNLSFWVNNAQTGITVEAYVKNVFDETPITGTFLNSDDSGLTTNVFTLDPRLIGVSVRKEF